MWAENTTEVTELIFTVRNNKRDINICNFGTWLMIDELECVKNVLQFQNPAILNTNPTQIETLYKLNLISIL